MDLIKLSREKGFMSRDKLVTINSDYFYLWMCELQKWLREEHNCIVEVTFYSENIESIKDIKYEVEIDYYGKDFHNIGDSSDYYSSGYDTYEKALEVGLFEGLKLIK